MKDLKSKWEMVDGYDFQKEWEEKEPLRMELCDMCHAEAIQLTDELAVMMSTNEQTILDHYGRQ
jgi:hypothetical protein